MKFRYTRKLVLNVVLLSIAVLISQVMSQSSLAGDVDAIIACPSPGTCTPASLSASCAPKGYTERIGAMNDSQMGISVGTAGDVNGDCYADVIIGEYNYDNSDISTSYEGRVLIYYGSINGIDLTTSPDWIAEGSSNQSQFGFSCGTAGDLNGDGYDDIVIGAYKHKNTAGVRVGRVAVYYGPVEGKSVPDWEILGEHNGCWMGYSVAAAGDVNGDGVDDLVVGAPTYSNSQTFEGKIYVFFGKQDQYLDQTVADWSYESNIASAQFGNSVAAADVNGDQKSDIIVGAYLYGDSYQKGRVFTFHGDSTLNFQCKTSADWEKSGLNYSHFGYCVARAGDVNADGYDDVVIGAPNAKIDNLLHVGMAYVYYGSEYGLETYEDYPWVVQGVDQNEYLGYSVGSAGKINYDGATEYDDIFIGVPGYLTYDQGGVFLFHGSPYGVVGSYSTPACVNYGPRTYSGFGKSGGMAGDVNNDGCNDLIFGAPAVDSSGLTNCGHARLLYGYKMNGCPYLLPPAE